MPFDERTNPETGHKEMVLSKAWLKRHWQELAIGGITLIAAIWYLFLRNRGTASSSSTVPIGSPVAAPSPAAASAAQQSSTAASDSLRTLAQQIADQIKGNTQASQAAIQAALDASQSKMAASQAQQTSASQAALARIEAAATAAEQSIKVALGKVPSGTVTGLRPTASALPSDSQIASWASGLGDNVQTLTQLVKANGGRLPTSIDQLNGWIKQAGVDPTLSPQANQYRKQQGAGYQPGSQPASAASPAGGGLWKGLNDQQTQALFQATYGANWQKVWNQQHQAALSAGK